MKVETTSKTPKFNLMQPDGIRSQADVEDIAFVLLNDGKWYKIIQGSFKFYRTEQSTKNPGVPFVQFDTTLEINESGGVVRMEVFPATVAGIAYSKPSE